MCPPRKKSDSDVNGTVVVNMFTLEVAVEDVDTAGEKASKTTAHETLLIHAGWKRHHCFGAAVQKGQFRVVSGFINGLREGYKIVTAPAYEGPHSAFGQLQTDRPSEGLDAFKKFTKDNEKREKADIPEEACKLAVELAGVVGFSKASFFLDPLVQASTLEYLCSFDGGMEDCRPFKEMLEHSLMIYEKHLGEDHWKVAITLINLGKAHGDLGDPRKQKDLLERSLKIQEKHYGREHFEVAITLTNLGNAYGDLGEHNKKKDLLERALKLLEKHFGRDHFQVAITLYNLALAHGALGDRGNEARILIKVLPIFERHFGMHHEYCGMVKRALNDAAE